MNNIDYYSKYKKYKRKYLLLQYGGEIVIPKSIKKILKDNLEISLKDYPDIKNIFINSVDDPNIFIEKLKSNKHIKDFIKKLITIEHVPLMAKGPYEVFMVAVKIFIDSKIIELIDKIKPFLLDLLKYYKTLK
jgi:hypothetical protein